MTYYSGTFTMHDGSKLRVEDGKIVEHIPAPAAEPATDDTTPQCTVTWFKDGGRTEVTCTEPAEAICKDCGEGRCDEHQGDPDQCLIFYRTTEGFVICEECITDEQREGAEEVSTWHR